MVHRRNFIKTTVSVTAGLGIGSPVLFANQGDPGVNNRPPYSNRNFHRDAVE